MAELYQVTPQAIPHHIRGVYDEGKLEKSSTCKDYLQVQTEGARQIQRKTRHYNLSVNHSERFYRLMNQVMPGWEKRKQRLDNMANRIICSAVQVGN